MISCIHTLRKLPIKILFLYAVVMSSALSKVVDSNDYPNIVLLVSSDHAVETLDQRSSVFAPHNATPNLDSLFSTGIHFKNAYCVSAQVGPSFATLLTGRYPHKHRLTGSGKKFDNSVETIPRILLDLGYETAFFGQWPLGDTPMGFSHWEVLADGDQFYNPEFRTKSGKKTIEGHITDVTTDLFLDWIEKRKPYHKPFFALVHYNGTQRPWLPALRHLELFDDVLLDEPDTLFDEHKHRAPPSRYQEMTIDEDLHLNVDLFLPPLISVKDSNQINSSVIMKNTSRMNEEQLSTWQLAWRPKNEAFWREGNKGEALVRWKYQRFVKNYLRCLAGVDENIGRFINFAKSKQDLKSIVIYTAARGRFLGQQGWFGSSWAYEPSARIPLIIYELGGKDFSPMGKMQIVSNLDLAPTILSLFGESASFEFDGLNLMDEEKQITPIENRFLYFHHQEFPSKEMIPKHYGLINKTLKLIHYYQFDEWELFDLVNDPLEMMNIYKNDPQKTYFEQAQERLQEIRKKVADHTDTSTMPEEWRRIYRGPDARSEK